ncbi:SRPBCC family protein [Spirillospora sp. NPDC048911]|uniref:SRPBCC family protein n=1 Tax=Spirillospora sp. NPDC048911 TaxID=3364527 RepID=UPI003715BCF9
MVTLNRLFASDTVTINASADEVFAVVSDPVAMADLAEELVAVRWLDGATKLNVRIADSCSFPRS